MEGVTEAARRLKPHAYRTPVLHSASLDARAGGAVFLKCENLQHVGAFKFRGALNAISALPEDVRARGIVAYSSGNHAQAVARVGQILDVRDDRVPADAPAIKARPPRRSGPAWCSTIRSPSRARHFGQE
jgi:threonine dehydratase